MRELILVVDDEADMESLFRQQFRRDLRSGRFEVEFATSAPRALELIEAPAGRDIVLLFSDINMPGMSGLELLPRVRATRPDVPVVMVTAYADPETRRRALAAGAEGFLPKPIDFAALRAEVERRLDHGGSGA